MKNAALKVVLVWAVVSLAQAAPIDRQALVTRHSPTITKVDPAAPFMVGNGEFAFTADITGLQTFPEQYSPRVPLLIQSQWGWHSFPNPKGFTLEDALVPLDVRGKKRKYPALTDWEQAKAPHIQWLRENPHRFSLGRVALRMKHADGRAAAFAELTQTRQKLDLWNGRLESRFVIDGEPVDVVTSVHPGRDLLIVRLRSKLIADGRLGVDLKFPSVGAKLNPDPADWTNTASHTTRELSRDAYGFKLARQLDDTRYSVNLGADQKLDVATPAPHVYSLAAPGAEQLTLLVEFTAGLPAAELMAAESADADVQAAWRHFWSTGAAVEFTGSKDLRAPELERRIVLSQYLTAVNSAGSFMPQEEGLFSNSWNGKSHLEMHAWHAAHFAAWGRPGRLEASLKWYPAHLEDAKRRAKANGVRGAWWPKMTGPEGRESPSTINPFIMWQQPHPIYMAEVLYGARPERAVLEEYRDVVFETAELLASWPHYDKAADRYVLGPPLVPAQENFPPLTTFNPTFEIEYFRFGLETAQTWRERLGLEREPRWDAVLAKLPKLPQKEGLYLAAESRPDLWDRARTPQCSKVAKSEECPNRDHPSFVAALGYLPGKHVDRETMRRTLDAVMSDWDLRQTWGWDWPMLAMTAWRLGERDRAFDFLLSDAKNFQFGLSGMTPRLHLDADAAPHAAGSLDVPGYRRVAETYFPSNGALLLAVALMSAEAEKLSAADTKSGWVMRAEGFKPIP